MRGRTMGQVYCNFKLNIFWFNVQSFQIYAYNKVWTDSYFKYDNGVVIEKNISYLKKDND